MPENVTDALLEPFHSDEVKWKVQTVKGDRCLCVCYVDARAVMDRLDRVLGIDGWQDAYEVLPDGNVVCTLKVRFPGCEGWISRQDVGGESEQPDEGDKRKASFSDALKRAAVKFGVGRYLYRLPQQWVDYDAQKKRPKVTPTLPEWALPGPKKAKGKKKLTPGEEILAAGGDLAAHVLAGMKEAGIVAEPQQWVGAQLDIARELAREFEAASAEALTDEEYGELQLLMEDTQTDAARFAAHLKVANLGVLPRSRFAEAMELLRKKAAKLAANGAQ